MDEMPDFYVISSTFVDLGHQNSLKSGTVDLFVKLRPAEEPMAGSAL